MKVKQNANIELHDIRLVVGSKIEDRYDTLRKDWFGSLKRLHIHSYKKIQYIDGYKVDLLNMESKKKAISKKNNPPKNYGLAILEDRIQLLCRKNISLD